LGKTVEQITWNKETLAYVIREEIHVERTTFFTPPQLCLQVGQVVYPAGGKIAPHVHLPLERHIVGTQEVLIVKKGRCQIDIYNDNKVPIATRELRTGDIVILMGGGHGFHMLEDTVFLEIKQGPYLGLEEKEHFEQPMHK
jgi:hypothetical protein